MQNHSAYSAERKSPNIIFYSSLNMSLFALIFSKIYFNQSQTSVWKNGFGPWCSFDLDQASGFPVLIQCPMQIFDLKILAILCALYAGHT